MAVEVDADLLGLDEARRHAVDAHALTGEVERHLPGQRVHRSLRGAVGGVGRESDRRRHRADVHYRTAAARDHVRDRVARAREDAPYVRVEHAVVRVAFGLGDRLQQADAGVVAEDVDSAVARKRLADDPLAVALVANVRRDEGELEALVAEHARELLTLRDRSLGGDDGGAFGGETLGDRSADATTGACDECHLSLESPDAEGHL